MSLDVVLTPERVSDGHFALDVPAGWAQGRGAYGGIAVGALVRAIELHVDDRTRAPRSLTAELTGPIQVGRADVHVRVLRAGNAVSTVAASIEQGGEVLAHGVLVLGADRRLDPPLAPVQGLLAPPEVEPFDAAVPLPFASPPWPEFAQNFELRLARGLPFSGDARPESIGWVRPHVRATRIDAAYVAALADVYWSSAAVAFTAPRPFATIGFTLGWVLAPSALTPETPLLHRGRVLAVSGGYVEEDRELWTPDGRLVALNRQTVAVIK